MADPTGEPVQVAEPKALSRITGKIHGHHSSSLESDADVKSGIHRLFGREKPVHKLLGGGKYADVLLWRKKKKSCLVVCGGTIVWIVFEGHEYNFITLICNITIVALSFFFLLSNASSIINKSAPQIPEIQIPENFVLEAVSIVRSLMIRGLAVARYIAIGKDLGMFFKVIIVLWLISVVGSWFNFLTTLYLMFISMHTLPALYEKYQDRVDPVAEKAVIKLRKRYAILDKKVMNKIPLGLRKEKFL